MGYNGKYWNDYSCDSNIPSLCKVSAFSLASPTTKSGYITSCSPFSVADTSSTTQNYASCNTIACAGDTLSLLLSEHTGDNYFLLFDESGIKVAEWNLFLRYSVPANSTTCTNYEIREGCSGSGSCSGTLTTICTGKCAYDMPSTSPTTGRFHPVPLQFHRWRQQFPVLYSNHHQNYVTCPFTLCGGDRVVISLGCDCTGDTYIQLYDSTGTFLASNNDYCGQCSALIYTVPGGAACSTYVLREACNGFGSCSGTASIKIHSPSPTSVPTTSPTLIPSKSPGIPTMVPSMRPSAPSIKPTSVPSRPTVSPSTRKPTVSPTLFSVMYTYTGSVQTYTVGAGRYSITITACGAQGGSTAYSTGGLGGCITTNIEVAPFQTLYVFVGGA
eukprot:gene12834-27060_t